MTTLYGISNCDTIKKAKKWLEAHNVDYVFYDYKKQPVETSFLQQMIELHGLDVVVNKRGTTFRKLSQEQKDGPILTHNSHSLIGFKTEEYAHMFDSKA